MGVICRVHRFRFVPYALWAAQLHEKRGAGKPHTTSERRTVASTGATRCATSDPADSPVRHPGVAWPDSLFGECTAYEEGAGRRTDWHECQWLQYLHSVGLLRGAFRPEAEVTALRTILRHRQELVQMSSQHVLHMHKALTQMNLQIHHVIDDITGVTGLAIVDAILAGQRDAVELAKLRNWRIKA